MVGLGTAQDMKGRRGFTLRPSERTREIATRLNDARRATP